MNHLVVETQEGEWSVFSSNDRYAEGKPELVFNTRQVAELWAAAADVYLKAPFPASSDGGFQRLSDALLAFDIPQYQKGEVA